MKFLLDTNFLASIARFKIDLKGLEEFGKPELFTIDLVMKELEKIKEKQIVLSIIASNDVRIISTHGKKADDELINIGKKDFIVCTQDRELIKKLSSNGIPVVCIRQRKYFIRK